MRRVKPVYPPLAVHANITGTVILGGDHPDLFALSAVAIAGFYGAAFGAGQHTPGAHSPEFLQLPVLDFFRWLRVIGDTIFTIGVVAVVLFVYGLITGHSTRPVSEKVARPGGKSVPIPVRH